MDFAIFTLGKTILLYAFMEIKQTYFLNTILPNAPSSLPNIFGMDIVTKRAAWRKELYNYTFKIHKSYVFYQFSHFESPDCLITDIILKYFTQA